MHDICNCFFLNAIEAYQITPLAEPVGLEDLTPNFFLHIKQEISQTNPLLADLYSNQGDNISCDLTIIAVELLVTGIQCHNYV